MTKKVKTSKSLIYSSLLKYGYSNFKLEILEYCDKQELAFREQFYLYYFKPSYNILNLAYSSVGYKHSSESKIKIKNAMQN